LSPSQPPPSQGEEPIELRINIEIYTAPFPAKGRFGWGLPSHQPIELRINIEIYTAPFPAKGRFGEVNLPLADRAQN
jgi:hypothetical protein